MTIFLAVLTLTACGENDAFLAKAIAPTDAQRIEIVKRIQPVGRACVRGQDCESDSVSMMVAQMEAVNSLPGKAKYAGCVACHGGQGQGGVGPMLAGKEVEYITGRLTAYRNNETVGAQSALMWGQAAGLSDKDIADLAEYIKTL